MRSNNLAVRLATGSALALLGGFLGCVTINVYFPEEEIRDLSVQIEEEVRRQAEGTEGESDETPTDARVAAATAWPVLAVAAPLGGRPQSEEVPAPEITNPAIRRIIDSRAERWPALRPHLASGVVGENNRALLELRDLQKVTSLQERATVQRLVREENADRERLFQEIARAKGVEAAQIPLLRKTYAETIREQARPGVWIQLPDGTWKQKEALR